jgi:hypothetical protein
MTNKQVTELKYNVSFKTTWTQHTLLQEIASKQGKDITTTARELLDMGIDVWSKNDQTKAYSPKVQLAHEVNKTREKDNIRAMLREVRWSSNPKKFNELCQLNGEDPKDYQDIPQPEKAKTQPEKAQRFLRILFSDRPDGLPMTRVIELAAEENLGSNLIRSTAKAMGRSSKRESRNGKQVSVLRIP